MPKRARKRKPKDKRGPKPAPTATIEPDQSKALAEWLAVTILVTLGLIYSLHFLGHFVFPNPDFAAFLRIGRQWVHLEIPSSMKRAPLFAIITATVGRLFSGPGHYLYGAEVYNALMLPAAMVLIYLIGRRFLGKAAIWVALLAGISPWMVRMSSQPLAELTLVALFAAAALCAGGHIKWAYLFVMLGSIARWDLAGLIPAVALVDLIRNRKWVKTVALTALASVPFGLCMLITRIQLQGQAEGAHYLQVLAKDMTFELPADLRFYWNNICSFLNADLIRTLSSGQVERFEALNSAVFVLSAVLLAVAFLTGSVTAVIRKRWEIIVMLLAGIPYVMVHAIYPYRLARFCVPVQWIGLVIAAYGALVFWQWFAAKPKPKFLVPVLQLAGAVIFIVWAIKIADTLKFAKRQCPVLGQLVTMSSILVVVGFVILQVTRRGKPSLRWLIVPAFLVLAVVSNGTTTGFLMGSGQSGANFKRLGLWFYENAKADDRMLTTMPSWMPIYTDLPIERFEHPVNIPPEQAKDFPALIRECRKLNVTLIAWDSRLAGSPNDRYYKLWGLDRIQPLGAPFYGRRVDRVGPCKLVHIIADGSPKIAVYRIMPPSAE